MVNSQTWPPPPATPAPPDWPPSALIFPDASTVTGPSVGTISKVTWPPSAPLPEPPGRIEPPFANTSPVT